MLDALRYYLENYVVYSRPAWLATIEQHNAGVFPLQLAGFGIGLWLLWQVATRAVFPLNRARVALVFLGLGWMIIGVALYLQTMQVLDWTALITGRGFILQGISLVLGAALLSSGVAASRGGYKVLVTLGAMMGLFGFALVQWLLGRSLYQIDWIGSGGGSTALITVAVVMVLPRRYCVLLLIPWLWSLRQFTVSWPLQDYPGMLLLPWITLCALAAVIHERPQQQKRSTMTFHDRG